LNASDLNAYQACASNAPEATAPRSFACETARRPGKALLTSKDAEKGQRQAYYFGRFRHLPLSNQPLRGTIPCRGRRASYCVDTLC